MTNFLAGLRSPAIASAMLVFPLAILEFMFNTVNRQSAPSLLVLFGFLWLLPVTFLAVLSPMVRHARTGNESSTAAVFFLRLTFLAIVALVWGSLLVDQLPCFLGAPNCD